MHLYFGSFVIKLDHFIKGTIVFGSASGVQALLILHGLTFRGRRIGWPNFSYLTRKCGLTMLCGGLTILCGGQTILFSVIK